MKQIGRLIKNPLNPTKVRFIPSVELKIGFSGLEIFIDEENPIPTPKLPEWVRKHFEKLDKFMDLANLDWKKYRLTDEEVCKMKIWRENELNEAILEIYFAEKKIKRLLEKDKNDSN